MNRWSLLILGVRVNIYNAGILASMGPNGIGSAQAQVEIRNGSAHAEIHRVDQVRRLVLENDYLWVYPVMDETDRIVLSRDARGALGQLLLRQSVYVEKRLISAVRQGLKMIGRGQGGLNCEL